MAPTAAPSTQQGYSPFSTWTRGLAWALLGFAEQLEFVSSLPAEDLAPFGGRDDAVHLLLDAARATADLDESPVDGIPYWDTGAPLLPSLGERASRPADAFNDCEPVDSSAAAIACQGLLRLGTWLAASDQGADGARCTAAGLTTLATLIDREGPYLSTEAAHEGLILHAVYHRPNAGTTSPRAQGSPEARRASGATTTCGRRRCSPFAWPGVGWLTFFRPSLRKPT